MRTTLWQTKSGPGLQENKENRYAYKLAHFLFSLTIYNLWASIRVSGKELTFSLIDGQ